MTLMGGLSMIDELSDVSGFSTGSLAGDIAKGRSEIKRAQQKYVKGFIRKLFRADGDLELRKALGHEGYRGTYDDVVAAANEIFPQTIGVKLKDISRGKGRFNSGWNAFDGTIYSGLPGRATIAHELGHAASIPKNSLRGFAKNLHVLGATPLATAGASYALSKQLGLNDEQAALVSVLPTYGMKRWSTASRLKEEFDASRNALRILHRYNKNLDPVNNRARDAYYSALDALETAKKAAISPTNRSTSAKAIKELEDRVKLLGKRIPKSVITSVDTKKAKNSLKLALGTYKANLPRTHKQFAIAAAIPVLGIYGANKLRDYIKNRDNDDTVR